MAQVLPAYGEIWRASRSSGMPVDIFVDVASQLDLREEGDDASGWRVKWKGWRPRPGLAGGRRTGIGMAYLPTARAVPGTEFEIDVRGRRLRARVVPLPFYKRPRS